MEQEKNGVQFPVDFDIAWQIPEYKKRQNAYLIIENNLIEGEDYIKPKNSESDQGFLPKSVKNPHNKDSNPLNTTQPNQSQGRPKRSIYLTCDGFKQFCLLARTKTGRKIRQYFIEAEKNWKLVQQKHPDVAQDVELEKLKFQSEIAKHKCEETKAQERIMKTSESIMKIHGSKMLSLMMGNPDAVVEKVEYRDRGSNETSIALEERRIL